MSYLDIENDKLNGWFAPMYLCSAEQFAEEVKQACVAGSSGTGVLDTPDGKITLYHTNYKYKDGTKFVLTYNKDGELIEIEGKCSCDEEFETIFYNNSITTSE